MFVNDQQLFVVHEQHGSILRVRQVPTSVRFMQTTTVRQALAGNLKRARQLRRSTVRQLSDRFGTLGRPMLPSAVSNAENGHREMSVEDLLAFAYALNVSPVDLLMPADPTTEVTLSSGMRWQAAAFFEDWLRGDGVWPPDADPDEFFDLASPNRKRRHKVATHPIVQELNVLQSAVMEALTQGSRPDEFATYLKDRVRRVSEYVDLLVDEQNDRRG